MAEGGVVGGVVRGEERSLDELEKEITCTICYEYYTEPKVLPCLHYFCKQCLVEAVQRINKGKPFTCPECRREILLVEEDLEDLQTAFFINRIQSTLLALKKVTGKTEMKCEECTEHGENAEAFCRQCAVFICGECVKQHKRMRSFASHEVVTLEDLRHGRAREIAVKEPVVKNCKVHEEPLIVYCFDCSILICHHCTAKLHKDHSFEFSKIVAPDVRKKLLDELSPVQKVLAGLSNAMETVITAKKNVQENGDSVSTMVQSSFQQLQQILEKRKEGILHEVEEKVKNKLGKLSMQEKRLSLACADVQHTLDYTEQCVRHSSDYELLSVLSDVKKGIQHKTQEYIKSGMSFEPMEDADIGVKVECAEDLQQLCLCKAKVTRLAVDPVLCTVKGDGLKTAVIHHVADVILTVRLINGKTIVRGAAVEGQLKSISDGSVIQCDVDHMGYGEYSIKYTPIVRGRHELAISVDELVIKGSPFQVFVSVPLAKIGKPIKTWNGLQYARAVTFNSNGDVIAVCNQGIMRLDKDGTACVLVPNSLSTLQWMKEVSTDQDNNIYCTDISTNRVLKCSKTGGDVKIYELEQQVKVPGHYGITVVRDEVFLCERGNSGTVRIYDRAFNFKRDFKLGCAGILHSICVDSNDRIYATDYTSNLVHVLNYEGVLQQPSFGSDSTGVKQLKDPYGLCVDRECLYVVNYIGHSVSVFSLDGDYLLQFGQHGEGMGDFNKPCDVCVDKDGFIYVADDLNHRVQCF